MFDISTGHNYYKGYPRRFFHVVQAQALLDQARQGSLAGRGRDRKRSDRSIWRLIWHFVVAVVAAGVVLVGVGVVAGFLLTAQAVVE